MKKVLTLLPVLLLSAKLIHAQAGTETTTNTPQPQHNNTVNPESQSMEKLDPVIIQKLRIFEQNVKNAASNPQALEKSQKELSTLAGQYPNEMKFINEQREQENASKSLNPEQYDNWKRNKHHAKKE